MKKQRDGGFLISKIHRLAGRMLAKKLKKYRLAEINPAQGRILFVLWRSDGISIQDLAKQTSLGKSTLTSMLDRLEAAGFLTRGPSAGDRRKILIHLTKKYENLQDIYVQVSNEMTEIFYDGFSSKEIDAFESYLRRILNNLNAFETKAKVE